MILPLKEPNPNISSVPKKHPFAPRKSGKRSKGLKMRMMRMTLPLNARRTPEGGK
jgi:hypothetical protein